MTSLLKHFLLSSDVFISSFFLRAFCKRLQVTMAPYWKELISEMKNNITSLIDRNYRVGEVADLLSVNRSTCGEVYKRYCDRTSVKNKERSGRPPTFTKLCASALSKILKKSRTATRVEWSRSIGFRRRQHELH